MNKQKDIIYDFIMKNTLVNNSNSKGLDTQLISNALSLQRSNVSSILNELVREDKLEKSPTRPVLYKVKESISGRQELSPFPHLIGDKGSLRHAIQLAQAAILYPQNGFVSVISSSPGAGRSRFVYSMYQFAEKNKILAGKQGFKKIIVLFLVEDLIRYWI